MLLYTQSQNKIYGGGKINSHRYLHNGGRMKIKNKLLMMNVIPLLVIVIITTIMGSMILRDGILSEIEDNLHTNACSVNMMYNQLYYGDWGADKGELYKGYTLINDKSILDEIKNNTELDTTIVLGDIRMMTTLGDSLVGTKINADVWSEVQKGNSYFDSAVVIDGKDYCGYYLPIYNEDGEVYGSIFTGKKTAEVSAFINKCIGALCGTIILIAIIAGVIVTLVAMKISKALTAISTELRALADGDLSRNSEIAYYSTVAKEFDLLCHAYYALQKSLSEIIAEVRSNSVKLTDESNKLVDTSSNCDEASQGIMAAVDGVAKGAMSMAESIETAANNIVVMGDNINDIATCVKRLNGCADDLDSTSNETLSALSNLREVNETTINSVDCVGKQVSNTSKAVQQIGDITGEIEDISSQTNLLSLNASIEAARAGEAGRGFEVVASEIRELAVKSAQAAKSIAVIANNLLEESSESVKMVEELSSNSSEQSKTLEDTTRKFEQLMKRINETREETKVISEKADEVNSARMAVNDTVQDLSAISQENAASAEETTASMTNLGENISQLPISAETVQGVVEKLNGAISKFK